MNTITKILLLTSSIFATAQAKLTIIASIAPEQSMIEEIAGDKAQVVLMVPPGSSPHTYEPKPSQMIAISKADAYFTIGVEFEQTWIPRFHNQNKSMRIIDIAQSITKLPMQQEYTKSHTPNKDKNKKLDPHIWTTPKNIQTLGQNITAALISLDPANTDYYKHNSVLFAQKAQKLQNKLDKILDKPYHFMVFHPAWGYLAHEYNLIQLPIEIEGKAIKAKSMISLMKKAKSENITVIFTSPAFSDQVAKQMAHELGIKVSKVSTLKRDWYNNILTVSSLIANNQSDILDQ